MNIVILGSTTRGKKTAPDLEALYQKELTPSFNTKDENKSRIWTFKL